MGIAPDDKKAKNWYERAAANDEIRAKRALALMEIAGEGGKIDRVDAFLLYTRLAEKGYTDVLPSMAKLRKEITPKEWELLQKSLRHMRIDPAKLDATLQGIDAK
jgi:TPR repeat protein